MYAFVLVGLLAYAADAAVDKDCVARCAITADYQPRCLVVEGKYETVPTPSMMNCYDSCGVNYLYYSDGSCPPPEQQTSEECMKKCPVTADYNPVCTNVNGNTHDEPTHSILNCYTRCGIPYTVVKNGPCNGYQNTINIGSGSSN